MAFSWVIFGIRRPRWPRTPRRAHASYTATWSKAPYGALPATAFRPNPDPEVHVVLPPADNVVQNWGFENGATGWQFGGTLPAMITTSAGHSGSSSALLGSAGQPLQIRHRARQHGGPRRRHRRSMPKVASTLSGLDRTIKSTTATNRQRVLG